MIVIYPGTTNSNRALNNLRKHITSQAWVLAQSGRGVVGGHCSGKELNGEQLVTATSLGPPAWTLRPEAGLRGSFTSRPGLLRNIV